MEKKIAFDDAQELHRQNPKSSFPDQEEMDRLAVGDKVHVRIQPEEQRFWVTVDELDGDKIAGRIVQGHVNHSDKHGLEYGDKIHFERKNVYGISTQNLA